MVLKITEPVSAQGALTNHIPRQSEVSTLDRCNFIHDIDQKLEKMIRITYKSTDPGFWHRIHQEITSSKETIDNYAVICAEKFLDGLYTSHLKNKDNKDDLTPEVIFAPLYLKLFERYRYNYLQERQKGLTINEAIMTATAIVTRPEFEIPEGSDRKNVVALRPGGRSLIRTMISSKQITPGSSA
jgi:hypothetical protein